jgi:hypothetical protein
MADMSNWVKAVGLSVLLVGIISIIVSKFRGIDDIDTTANASLGDGLTLLGDMVDYIEIGVLILIGAFFFSKLTKKGGFGQ